MVKDHLRHQKWDRILRRRELVGLTHPESGRILAALSQFAWDKGRWRERPLLVSLKQLLHAKQR